MTRSQCVPSLLLTLTAASLAFALAPSDVRPTEKLHPTLVQVKDAPGLPRVLLIGDSVSMWYTLPVRELLKDEVNHHRPPVNCHSSQQVLTELETYLGDKPWDIIHFNCGGHDISYRKDGKYAPPPDGVIQVTLADYKSNLRAIVKRLKATGARIVWANTTPMSVEYLKKGHCRQVDLDAYNTAAAEIMKDAGIPINDLYSLTKADAEKLLKDGVHFTPEGSNVLAHAVGLAVRGQLPAAKPFAPAIVFAGTATERGIAYGKLNRNGIRAFMDQEVLAAFVGKSFTKADMLKYAADCGRVIREVCPMVADEIAGIAEGAGVSEAEVIMIQLHEEFYRRNPLLQHGHCIAVAVNPNGSGNRHAYLGQTWDWMVTLAGKSSITEWQRGKDGLSVLAYGYPGMPIGAGLNANGVCLCWTSGGLSTRGMSPRVGLPSYTLIAHLLNQPDIESVIREAQRDCHAGWFTFVVNDAKGNIINIEGSPAGVVIERATGDVLVRSDYGTKTKQAETISLRSSWKPAPRVAVFEKLLGESKGRNDRVRLQNYLSDPALGIPITAKPRNVSIDVMLFDTTARTAYFSRGPDYGIQWRAFEFKSGKQ